MDFVGVVVYSICRHPPPKKMLIIADNIRLSLEVHRPTPLPVVRTEILNEQSYELWKIYILGELKTVTVLKLLVPGVSLTGVG